MEGFVENDDDDDDGEDEEDKEAIQREIQFNARKYISSIITADNIKYVLP